MSNNDTQVRKNAPKQVVGAVTKNCNMHAVSKMSTLQKLPRGRPDVGVFNHTPLLKDMFGIKMAGLLRYFSSNSIGSSRSSQASKRTVADDESDNDSTVIQTPTTKKAKRCFRAKWQDCWPWVAHDEDKDLMYCSVCRQVSQLLTLLFMLHVYFISIATTNCRQSICLL